MDIIFVVRQLPKSKEQNGDALMMLMDLTKTLDIVDNLLP